jgi:hypothetical protein
VSELVLAPTRAFTEGTGSSHAPYIVAPDVSGGASVTAWIDNDDTTYGKCDANRSSRGQYLQWQSVDPSIDPSWITAFGVRFRASSHISSSPFVVQLFAQTSKLLSNPFHGASGALLTDSVADAWTYYDYVVPDADYDTAGWAPLGVASAADPLLTLYCRTVPTDGSGEFTSSDVIFVSEQRLVVYYTVPSGDTVGAFLAQPQLGGVPPRRIHPRSDGLGASSARRTWPTPPSVQASNRRAGGYL